MKSRYEQIDLVGKIIQKPETTVGHLVIWCHCSQRPVVIGAVLHVYSGSKGRDIIFCETKNNVTEMAMKSHIKKNVQCLHGDTAQSQREITLKGFREGSFKVLMATNVDIPVVDLVIQSSPPQDVESYVHHSGDMVGAGGAEICIRFIKQKKKVNSKICGAKSTNYF